MGVVIQVMLEDVIGCSLALKAGSLNLEGVARARFHVGARNRYSHALADDPDGCSCV